LVASLVPKTLVVARAGILIEETILVAGRVVLPGNAAKKRILRVVTGASAFGIFRIDETVAVVVHAVTAREDFALARCDVTLAAAGTAGRDSAASGRARAPGEIERARSARRRSAAAATGERQILA